MLRTRNALDTHNGVAAPHRTGRRLPCLPYCICTHQALKRHVSLPQQGASRVDLIRHHTCQQRAGVVNVAQTWNGKGMPN